MFWTGLLMGFVFGANLATLIMGCLAASKDRRRVDANRDFRSGFCHARGSLVQSLEH
jgi:hypothetical protein